MNAPHRFTDIRRVDETGSTNADVLALARNGEPEGVVVVAATQTAGRGRHGRAWVAPPGSGLLCSILLRPGAALTGLVIPAAALAVADTASAFGVHTLGIKWPNDVIVTDDPDRPGPGPERKIAGILAEAEWATRAADGPPHHGHGGRAAVALGIGLNVAACDGLPAEVAARRVALAELTDRPVEVDATLEALLVAFDGWYTRLGNDPAAVLAAWRERCVTIGRRVRVDLGARDIEGVAVDVDDAGRLVVERDDGTERVVAAGDVVHLRDATRR